MTNTDEIQFVTFRIADTHFGFNVFEVERVVRYEGATRLPDAPDFLEGMAPYADRLVPVIDLRKRLGVDAEMRSETRMIVLEWEQGRIGVVVDAVTELIKVAADRVSEPPPIVRGLAAEYLRGIIRMGERTIVVLAASRLLNSTERLTLETMTLETPA